MGDIPVLAEVVVMSGWSGSRRSSRSELEDLFEAVRGLEPGGDLEGLLEERLGALRRLVYEDALAERSALEREGKGSFPPSDVRDLRLGSDAPPGAAGADGADFGG